MSVRRPTAGPPRSRCWLSWWLPLSVAWSEQSWLRPVRRLRTRCPRCTSAQRPTPRPRRPPRPPRRSPHRPPSPRSTRGCFCAPRQPVTTTPTTVRPRLTVAPVTTHHDRASRCDDGHDRGPAGAERPRVRGRHLQRQRPHGPRADDVRPGWRDGSATDRDDAFLVTTETDAAGDFDWTGTGPACAPDTNLFVGLFGALTTTTTSCEVDCFESTVTDEPQ